MISLGNVIKNTILAPLLVTPVWYKVPTSLTEQDLMKDFYGIILSIFQLFELPVAWHHPQTLLITVAPLNPSNLPSLAKAPHRVGMAILILVECGPPNLLQTPQYPHKTSLTQIAAARTRKQPGLASQWRSNLWVKNQIPRPSLVFDIKIT